MLGRKSSVSLAASVYLLTCGVAVACESEAMQMTDSGFILKVVAGSNKIDAKVAPDSEETAYTLELLQPYYVICEDGEFYKITDLPADTVDEAETGNVGYVLRNQTYLWPTREALNFSPLVWGRERPEIVAWDEEDVFVKFLETGDINLNPPAFREDLESTLKRERSTRPYPVLSSQIRLMLGSKEKRTFDVLLPAALPPSTMVEIAVEEGKSAEEVVGKVEETLTSATFAIAFDATASMNDFARDVADDIRVAFESLPEQVLADSKIGFVFYRDETDEEKQVVVPPLPVKDAANALREAASYMSGGGDAAEPVLDATYIATNLFPWDTSGGQGGVGRKVLIIVLNDDAKPVTTGGIDDRVPPGMGPADLVKQLVEQQIEVVTVQAGPNAGENLVPVLSALAEGSGGSFISWGGGDRRERVTAAVAAQLVGIREKVSEEGAKITKAIEFDYRGYPTIPLAVLDGEKLERLRRAGIEFNINNEEGGVLVTKGYMLENPDLLEPQVQIEKKTLESLVHLFSILGASGVDVDSMIQSACEAIGAIAGEECDPEEPIANTIKRQLGIQFRTKLLEFNLEYLAGLTQPERLALTKRIQDAGDKLSRYLEANLAAFDTNPAVWMPVEQLP